MQDNTSAPIPTAKTQQPINQNLASAKTAYLYIPGTWPGTTKDDLLKRARRTEGRGA